jgi:hypothetical protein
MMKKALAHNTTVGGPKAADLDVKEIFDGPFGGPWRPSGAT